MDTRVSRAGEGAETRSCLSPLLSGPERRASEGPGRGSIRAARGTPSTPPSSARAAAAASVSGSLTAPGPSRGWSRTGGVLHRRAAPGPPRRGGPLPEPHRVSRQGCGHTGGTPSSAASRRKTPPLSSCHWLHGFGDEQSSPSIGRSRCQSPRRRPGNVVLSKPSKDSRVPGRPVLIRGTSVKPNS